ncbi:MAG TPA: endolytic transglycosylase MltG, partial [Beijerinckiaceae bacterium]|nr:endolytic transglycosylase MltG [Beijerinckiaceae bacterium]
MFRKKTHNFIPLEGELAPEEPPRLVPKSPSEAIKPLAAPPPPPRMRRRRGLLSVLSGALTLAVLLAFAGIFGVAGLEQQVREPGPLAQDKVVVIPRNIGTSEIADVLRREGVISRSLLFRAYAYLNRQRGPLKAGEFQFKAGASIDDAIDTLIEGRAILHAFTAPEGLTSEQIVARLRENEVLTGDITEVPREGSLLPDTYKFERGTTRQQLVNLMQEKHRQALTQVWSRKSPDLPIRTPQELVILASIVEKETGRSDERGRVAGVFVNRLGKRMKLQSDPTIVYGLVGGKGTLGRGILRSEIDKATPYNTYAIEGLPPGPIANPGRASLEAAANPARTRDLYFVADGTGGHAFAENLEQHQRNVVRWRQIERSRAAGEVDRAEPPPLPGDAAPAAPAPAPAPSPR